MTSPDQHPSPAATARRRRHACWLAAISLLGAAAACGGDDSSDDTDPTPPPQTEAAAPEPTEPTAPPTTTPTTDPTPDPTTTTTSTSTTLAPTTTQDPTDVLAAEVEAAYLEAVELRYAALSDPTDVAAGEDALDRFVEPMRSVVSQSIQLMRDNGYGATENANAPWTLRVEQGPTVEGGAAELVSCTRDTWVVVEVGAGPSGSDAVVDDNIYLYRNAVRLVDTESGWKIAETEELGFWTGLETCPDE